MPASSSSGLSQPCADVLGDLTKASLPLCFLLQHCLIGCWLLKGGAVTLLRCPTRSALLGTLAPQVSCNWCNYSNAQIHLVDTEEEQGADRVAASLLSIPGHWQVCAGSVRQAGQ